MVSGVRPPCVSVGSLSGTNSRIQDGVFVNSSCASSHACVSYLDALLAARRFAPSAVVGLCMHDDGSPVHDACSNSWSDTVRVQGRTGTRSSKGGVSGPAEDLRPVSEVEAGVNFSAGRRGGAVTPSLHPVPGIRFVSPGRGLDIRQSIGWTKVCGTAQSEIWMLKGNARTCMFLPVLTTFGWNG